MSEKVNLQIGNREMLHNKVCSVLRKAILKGEFKPGERLVQTELAERIGVSRMPIREALRTLELEGLIKIEPHKGAVVRAISKEEIKETYELRSMLEPLALEKSIPNLTTNDLELLKNLQQEMILSTGDTYIEKNKKFHRFLLSRCQSPKLLGLIDTISHGVALDTPEIVPGQIEKSDKEHKHILEAVIEGDGTKAAELLTKHIKRSGTALLKSLENQDFK